MDVMSLITTNVDVLMVIGMVGVIQIAKKALPKIPGRRWWFALAALAFLAAWIKVPVVQGHAKAYLESVFKYAAAAEFVYQTWSKLFDTAKKAVGGRR
jgi:hypothetical protein